MLLLYAALIEAEEDKLTFEHIYFTYRKRMLCIAQKVLGSAEDAEDAIQNALLSIAKSINNLPTGDERALQAYVFTVARNAAWALLPEKRRREGITELPEIAAETEDAFEQLCRLEDYEFVLNLICSLPLRYREVLLLRYVSDLSQAEIARQLRRKPGTVKQQLTRAKKLLAALYEKERMKNA